MDDLPLKRLMILNRHKWNFVVVGDAGAIHFWIRPVFDDDGEIEFHDLSGGIEMHSNTPPSWSEGKLPDNEKCWATGKPCWHDGSSLQAEEFWIPLLKSCCIHNGDYEPLWLALQSDYQSRLVNV